MITKEQRTEMVRYWWLKAQESLSSARREFEAGSYSFAMNRNTDDPAPPTPDL